MSMPGPLTSDHLVDRRQLKRKVTFWRVAAFLLVAIGVVTLGVRYAGSNAAANLTPHIARLSIEGVIMGDKDTLKLVHDIGESKSAMGMIISIESPGGTTTGSERLYEEIRLVAAKKPVVAVVGTMAASGGYIAAMGADQIVARRNSLVGSIGVLFQFPNFSKLMDTVGVKMESVKSSPLKAAPNGFEPTSDAARAALAALVDDSFVWFKEMVKERRHMSDAELAIVSDGRVFSGHQGMALKLVDQIGGEREAIAWLETKGVAKGLKPRDWKKNRSLERLGLFGVSAEIAEKMGLSSVSRLLGQGSSAAEAQMLDGLVSIWQVAPAD
jgi:protease IV